MPKTTKLTLAMKAKIADGTMRGRRVERIKKPMGRPPIDPSERRDIPVKAFVTANEKATLEAAAKAEGRTLSDWLRIAGMKATGGR